jgi:ubiquinone/menaquinone biosynthesis C-methylase UbiE
MVAILGFSKERITGAVQAMYADVAARPGGAFHFPVGREACLALGYSEDLLAGIPPQVAEAFAGVGCPFRPGVIRPGDAVLDLGAGAGMDSLIASSLVGPGGRVWALDLTPAMLARLRRAAQGDGFGNVEVIQGDAERIPLADRSVDVVTSNGALNLVPDKRRAIREIFRVLRPEGRVQVADVVISRPVPVGGRSDPELWAQCVVGASVDEDYLEWFRQTGFADVEVTRERDYFSHSPSAATRRIAASLGARAVELNLRRPAEPSPPSLLRRVTRRLDPRRLRRVGQRGLWGAVAAGIALLSCYGLLALVALLSVLGTTVELDPGLWAATVAGAAGLATLATALNLRRHRKPWPLLASLLGAGAVVYAMLGSYHALIEGGGFALLTGAVALDLYLLYRAELCP